MTAKWQYKEAYESALATASELKAENAKLHDFNETIIKEMDVVNAKRWKLVKDNARLRKLLAELYEDQCDECDRWKYRDRMRELGVDA